MKARNATSKRVLDYLIGVPAFLLAVPLMTLVGVVIWLADPGWVFYVQEREGYLGCRIRLFKFRTMYVDAERRLAAFLLAHPERRQEWEKYFKLDDDPRVLPVIGPFLRKSSLDELPNLWNLLRGDVTLVGPRPFPLYHVRRFDPEFRARRCSVPPGLTGPWQIRRGGLGAQTKWDAWYVRHHSLKVDLALLARTFPVLLRGKTWY